ncbi:MAG: ArnT family glycosyltransferase [Chloroflexota bacterium]
MAGSLNPFLGDFGDDAEFLVLGQALARWDGYAWINSPEQPAHNRYPPGYPVLVAATLLVTGTVRDASAGILPAKLATAATLLATVPLLWRFARARLAPWWAAGAVALFALNPVAIRFAVQVMSDVPYVPALLVTLLWAERSHARPYRWSWLTLGALLAFGAYVRSIGLPVAAGVLAWVWVRQGRPSALAATATFVAVMAPWWLRDAALAGGWRYLEELTSATYQDPATGSISAGGLLARAVENGAFVLGKPAAFGPIGLFAAGLGGLLLVLGAWRSAQLRGGAAEWAAAALFLSVLFWPIKTGRYLLPVIPLAGVYAVLGSLELRDRMASRTGRRALWDVALGGGVTLACTVYAALGARDAAHNMTALSRGSDAPAYYEDRPEWAHYLEAAAWLRRNADPADVAMARRHFALYVYSGRFVEKYRFDTTEDELVYLTAGSARKFVVEDAFDYLRGDFAPLPATLRARGGDLVLRYETSAPRVRVWELVRPR